MFNPPIAWVLTAAETAFGALLVSWGYPFLGGLLIGLAVGSFLARATMPWRIARFLRKSDVAP